MDPGQRRRSLALSPRLVLLGGAGLFALGFLLGLLASGEPAAGADPATQGAQPARVASAERRAAATRRDSGVAAAHASGEFVGPGARTVSATGTRAQLAPPAARWQVLAGEVRRAIANAVAEAARRSSGKVNGASCAVAVHVWPLDARDGELSIQAGYAMRPASVLKLVTCATALASLGEGAAFRTLFELRGEPRAGTLEGDLVARAGGDPVFDADDPSASVRRIASELADALRARGVERVRGALVLDEDSYAEPAPGPAWPSSREYWKDYCALAGGFSVNGGCLTAIVRATRPGQAADSRLEPRGFGLPRRGSVVTGPAKSRLDIAIGATRSAATLRGSIPADVPLWSARFAHPDPVDYFGGALLAALAAEGVVIRGGVRRERGAEGGPALMVVRSPMSALLRPILADSDNALADQLFLATGQQTSGSGTRVAGAAAARAALLKLGVPVAGFVQVDGSGLSRDNRISARQVTALLAAVHELGEPAEALLRGSLAVAGESGTLARRMRDGPARGRVRGKTGFIGGTSALAGIAESLAGEALCFAILVQYPRHDGLNTHCFKPMGDAICEAIVQLEGPGGL